MAYFPRIVCIPCFRLHMQIYMKGCGAVARLFHTYRSNFLGKKSGFFSEILQTDEEFFIVLELIWGVVISFSESFFSLYSLPDIHIRLKTYKEILDQTGLFSFPLGLNSHLEVLAHSK